MSELPKNPEAEKEAAFRAWVGPVQVRNRVMYGYNAEAMPPGSVEAYEIYSDRRSNKGIDHPEALKAAQDFRNITGYEAEDFYRYIRKLSGVEVD